MYGIVDIFRVVTRRDTERAKLILNIDGFVDLRNNIAHGDLEAQAAASDVRRYMSIVNKFCSRADGAMARQLARISGIDRPW
jgi:hypothetical protein